MSTNEEKFTDTALTKKQADFLAFLITGTWESS